MDSTKAEPADRPVVVYIAGSGRSGTTLLERMIGGIEGCVNVGELIDLARRVHGGDELCGCGERFSGCPFWREVGKRAFGGWEDSTVEQLRSLQWQVARQRYIPQHLFPFRPAAFDCRSTLYRQQHANLYRAIADTAGARIVVDASKWPAQAAALAGPEIDLRVIHVQRDVRGVAWSMGKRRVVRPQDTRGRDLMESSGVKTAALRWSACQSEVALLRVTRVPLVRIRYEDLISNAYEQVHHALEAIGLPIAPSALGHIGQRDVMLGPSHGLSGNPSRFVQGSTALSVDRAWQTQMPMGDKVVVSAIGLPHQLRWPSRSIAPRAGRRR